jgi:hypothetical protein
MSPEFHDPDRIVGDIFEDLATCQAEMARASLHRVAAAVPQALGAAVLNEAERNAASLAERTGTPRSTDVRLCIRAPRAGASGSGRRFMVKSTGPIRTAGPMPAGQPAWPGALTKVL